MIPFALLTTAAYPTGAPFPGSCTATPTAARFAGILQSTTVAVTFTVTRPVSSIARIFFRGWQIGNGDAAAATSSATGATTLTVGVGSEATNSYVVSTNANAFDDFFIEVVGDGTSVVSISSGTVWGANYLSQPVFSQTISN